VNQLRKAMVVDSRKEFRLSKEQRIKELLPDVEVVKFPSIDCAEKEFPAIRFELVLMIVDLDAARSPNDPTKSGAEFVDHYVLGAKHPVPPVITTFRTDDAEPCRLRFGDDYRIKCVRDTRLTAAFLHQNLLEWGIASKNIEPVLIDGSNGDLKKSLAYAFAPMHQAQTPEGRWELAWRLVQRLDSWLAMQAHEGLEISSDTAKTLSSWFMSIPSASEDQKLGCTAERFAWLHLLEAELLWKHDPVVALYLLIEAVRLNTKANKEPLGQPGEPIYHVAERVALKLRSKPKAKAPKPPNSALACDSVHVQQPAAGSKSYSISLWRTLLRDVVTRAAKDLGNNQTALAVEREMRKLLVAFQNDGNMPAALEIEARMCEVRAYRLSLFGRTLSGALRFSCDYGNRPGFLALWCVAIVAFFAFLYLPTPHPAWWPDCLCIRLGGSSTFLEIPGHWWRTVRQNSVQAVYYSIVTFTTLGYGDIYPYNTFGRIVAAAEAIFGFTAFGLLVSVISTKLRPH
jgi:hypothetical protein